MRARWTAWWALQATRIDAISLRERILLFITVLACLGAVANWAWLAPAQDAREQLLRRLDRQTTELDRARADVAELSRPVAADDTLRGELADVEARLVTARQTLADLSAPSAAQTTSLTELLVHLLHQQDGLTLLRTATMSAPPVVVVSAANASAEAMLDKLLNKQPDKASDKPPDKQADRLPDKLARQGVELTVTGSYAELTRYVQALELALPQVRWGSMWLRSDKRAPELTLQLYLVEARTP
jgi:MSHA biogenesis protein MshJ